MGSFDTVRIDGRVGQTKAFGKCLASLGIGDRVEICDADTGEHVADTGQVRMSVGGWVTVVDGVLTGWSARRDDSLAAFDTLGRLIAEPSEELPPPALADRRRAKALAANGDAFEHSPYPPQPSALVDNLENEFAAWRDQQQE